MFRTLIASATILFCSTYAAAEETIPEISATLDYAKPDEQAYENFFEAVSKHDGKVIHLKLEILPKQGEEPSGYTLTQAGADDATIECGAEAFVGLIDNLKTDYTLGFQHPTNFHAATQIYIGDRMRFPFQSVVCGAEGTGELLRSHLRVSGHFVVQTYEIPTQANVALFPYDPR